MADWIDDMEDVVKDALNGLVDVEGALKSAMRDAEEWNLKRAKNDLISVPADLRAIADDAEDLIRSIEVQMKRYPRG